MSINNTTREWLAITIKKRTGKEQEMKEKVGQFYLDTAKAYSKARRDEMSWEEAYFDIKLSYILNLEDKGL